MRGRLLLAALAGAGLVLLCGGLTPPPAYAQDDPAAESDPNSGGADSADTAPAADDTAATLGRNAGRAADRVDRAVAGTDANRCKHPRQAAGPGAGQECKRAGPRRARRLLRRAQRSDLDDRHGLLERGAIGHRRGAARRRLGAFERGLPAASGRRPSQLDRRPGLERDQARSRYSEICALRPRRQDRSGPAQQALRHDAELARSEDGVGRDRRCTRTQRLLARVASEACAVPTPASSLAQGTRRKRSRRQVRQSSEDRRQHGALALDARKSRVAAHTPQRSGLHGLRRQGRKGRSTRTRSLSAN